MLIRCSFAESENETSFDPFPGGMEARRRGCKCPYQPLLDGTVTFDSECPVHDGRIRALAVSNDDQ